MMLPRFAAYPLRNSLAPVFPLAEDFFREEPYSEVTQLEGTSLSMFNQWKLQDAVLIEEVKPAIVAKLAAENAESAKPLGKKLGVYVDGKLRFQSRDSDAIYAYADRRMTEKHSVWVAPVGSFVTAD